MRMALMEEEFKLWIRCMLSVYLSVLPFLYSSCFSFSTVCRCFLQFVQPVSFILNFIFGVNFTQDTIPPVTEYEFDIFDVMSNMKMMFVCLQL